MVELGKSTLSSQFVQVLDTPTNFSLSKHVLKYQTPQCTGPPNYPKESGSSPVSSIMYLRHLLILPTKFHPNLSTLNIFQDFRFPPPTLTQCHQNWSGFKIRDLRYEFLLNMKFKIPHEWSYALKLKICHFF